RPGEDLQILVAKVSGDLALAAGRDQPPRNASRGRLVVLAVGNRGDELGPVDDAVDIAVLAGELEEQLESPPSGIERMRIFGERGRRRVADLRRHVADQSLEKGLLGVEVGVECAERDTRAPGDADDRTVGKSAL